MRSSVAASEMLRDRLGAIVAEFELPTAFPPELEAELLESIAEADRGETMSADELLSRLRHRS